MVNVNEWLRQWHSDGVAVGIAELMYYRSKAAAFARHRKLHPPKAQTGALLSKTRGRGMEFDEVRHYQAGDDVRAIDWRVTARTGSPHTKLFREERERPVLFVVDLAASQHFGSQLTLKSVLACHLTAALAWLAVQRGDRVGALIGHPTRHVELRPQARQQGALRILHSLVEMQNESLALWRDADASAAVTAVPLDDLLRRAQQLAKPGTIIHIISDWQGFSDATQLLLQTLQRHNSLQVLQCSDPLENRLPEELAQQDIAISNGRQQRHFAAGDQQAREHYVREVSQQQQELLLQLQQLGLELRQFSAARPIEEQWPEVML
ncbi:DUF58 domain-containing protein [Pseudidiomarina insulisalsae]|uniref:DUF58 domain-containing protein n=1 Tax=Pseudidiomarina insulisalsae TaxID=575789 RepID=A0A432YEN1_9GAMM|nr:DUF58 domain-containing protein [Pseudidiomarina insulisalsae]RUO59401.1 DUF58 domain-containing protein [Pseudidiomarina insulisalsae]